MEKSGFGGSSLVRRSEFGKQLGAIVEAEAGRIHFQALLEAGAEKDRMFYI